MGERRKDKNRRVLKEGESQQKDGTYDYRLRTSNGKRHSIYAKTLEELREKEAAVMRDKSDGIRTHDFGLSKISKLKCSDVRRFYNMLADERNLKISMIDNIYTVLHQVLDLAVEDEYLRSNPSDNALKELKQSRNFDSEKKMELSVAEQAALRKKDVILALIHQKLRLDIVMFLLWKW